MKNKGYNVIISSLITKSDVYIPPQSKACQAPNQSELLHTICTNRCVKADHDEKNLKFANVVAADDCDFRKIKG